MGQRGYRVDRLRSAPFVVRLEYGEAERAAELIQLPFSAAARTATLRRPVNTDGEYHFDVFHIHQLDRLAGRIDLHA